ncbi:MAG: Protease HtpX [Chlamydiae bacterium]|nr:Protease HtpX [Chlamydiota bacterium]
MQIKSPAATIDLMHMFKRLTLFLGINLLVLLTLSVLLTIFNVQPYLNQHGVDYFSLMIFCLLWGMVGSFISLALSRKMAQWIMGVKIIDTHTSDPMQKQLLETVQALAQKAGLPEMPEVGVYESLEVNAFATGPTRRRSLVAVSRGLLTQMSSGELEAILGHEITHIANGDMVTMTLIQGVINAFVMFLARALALAFSGLSKGRSRRGSYLTYMVTVWILELIFMLLGSMVICWFSRQREYRADRGGADLAGREKMVSALSALARLSSRRDPKAEQPAFQAMKIASSAKQGLAILFATHPPIELRIQRLNID